VVRVQVKIEHMDIRDRLNRSGNSLDLHPVAPFAEVGHALDKSSHTI
jgi:hypothetical protein